MSNKLIFCKPNIWYVLTKLTSVIILISLLFGFWLGVFNYIQQRIILNPKIILNESESNIIALGIILTPLIIFTIFWILKRFANKDYLELNTREIIAKINGKENFIPYGTVNKIDFRVIISKHSSYDLKIITADKTFYVPNSLVNFWNFKEIHLEIINFVQKNKININITKNFDYRMITIKNYVKKFIFIGFWLFIIVIFFRFPNI